VLTLRAARAADALGIATVQVRSWQTAYAFGLNADWLAAMDPEEWGARHHRRLDDPKSTARYRVAEVEGRVIGFSMVGPARPPKGETIPNTVGEMYALYVLPETFGCGHGHRLLAEGRDDLRDAGCTSMFLWVMEGNDRAITFYVRQGLALDGGRKKDGWKGAGSWTDLRCSAPLDDVCADIPQRA
jgi:ribosomal protein S18 acetylase RimI-like enzyme